MAETTLCPHCRLTHDRGADARCPWCGGDATAPVEPRRRSRLGWAWIGLLACTVGPFVVAIIGSWLASSAGQVVNEGNSALFSVFWLGLVTVPTGLLAMAILVVVTIVRRRRRAASRPSVLGLRSSD